MPAATNKTKRFGSSELVRPRMILAVEPTWQWVELPSVDSAETVFAHRAYLEPIVASKVDVAGRQLSSMSCQRYPEPSPSIRLKLQLSTRGPN